eukprot:CAMPEP_0182893168 /NCGR_PEP_ID=MMETSP0034_2-20130328/24308_1 /TAXON_ID=156128 /ORGANISM="Nephroselmis pyriformis, Strain CCMP717" /LENGTH=285 /DNA_ID=CAMNT_0025026893 /DNA_START=285 /DNA_END=1139 /DNA_ORIENTATION=+
MKPGRGTAAAWLPFLLLALVVLENPPLAWGQSPTPAPTQYPYAAGPTQMQTFLPGEWDLSNHQIEARPRGDGAYSFCVASTSVTALPVDPTAGTVLSALKDDSHVRVQLAYSLSPIRLHGGMYHTMDVSSNGLVSVGRFIEEQIDDNTPTAWEAAQIKGVSVLYSDMDPTLGGSVTWQQLADRVVVSYVEVPMSGTNSGATSTAQVEFFMDGLVRLTYLSVTMAEGRAAIVGVSSGMAKTVEEIFNTANDADYYYYENFYEDVDINLSNQHACVAQAPPPPAPPA